MGLTSWVSLAAMSIVRGAASGKTICPLLAVFPAQDGRTALPWFDKLTTGLEENPAAKINLVLSLSKDGPHIRAAAARLRSGC